MPVVATAGAVITATAGAVGIAKSVLEEFERSALISGAFVNRTAFTFAKRPGTSEPYWGNWIDTPDDVTSSAVFIQEKEKKGKNEKEAAEEVAADDQLQKRFFSTFALDGRKVPGAKSLVVYDVDKEALGRQMSIVCLIQWGVRSYYAGVSLSTDGWLQNQANGAGGDMIKHIETVHTDLCKYSQGTVEVIEQMVGDHRFRISFQASSNVIFEVRQEG